MKRQPAVCGPVCERAGGDDDGERQEHREHAGEGGALLSALEGAPRDVNSEPVVRHNSNHPVGFFWDRKFKWSSGFFLYDDRHVFGCEKSKHEGVRRGHCQYKYKTKQDGLHVEGRVGDSVLLTLLEKNDRRGDLTLASRKKIQVFFSALL
jgi:hypothetical protein